VGLSIVTPPGTALQIDSQEGLTVMSKSSVSRLQGALSADQMSLLENAGWKDRVGAGMGVWVSVREQMLRVIERGDVVYQARCATAANGVGSEMNSMKTPAGWHTVKSKIGADAPWGQVFRSRQPTREIWKPGDDVVEDMVLTRVLHLDGLEPGVNKGGNVDSFARAIYIHGTNDEARIGTPSSHGCVRMYNDEVIELFELLPEAAPVLITVE
jgi:lipoprotein-anchoring transpeptidase ErfK/SrfK